MGTGTVASSDNGGLWSPEVPWNSSLLIQEMDFDCSVCTAGLNGNRTLSCTSMDMGETSSLTLLFADAMPQCRAWVYRFSRLDYEQRAMWKRYILKTL